MMSGDNFTEDASRKRVALGDLTNRSTKRDFSSIAVDLGPQPKRGHRKILVNGDENLRLAKQSKKGLSVEEDKQESDSPATDTGIDLSQGDDVSSEKEEVPNLLDRSANVIDLVTKSVDEVEDESRDSCGSTGSMPDMSWLDKKDCDEEGRLYNNDKQKNLAISVCTSVEKDIGGGELASNLCGVANFLESQGSKSLDRFNTLKGCANFGASADLLKACNCSFCMKAAYIWSDLHYQDIKGRLAALKKSKKEACMLANKYTRGKQTEIHSAGNINKSSNLESDLTDQWKSLFDRMEDIFAHESNQLQAGYVALNDLREKCKMDLERTTGISSNKY